MIRGASWLLVGVLLAPLAGCRKADSGEKTEVSGPSAPEFGFWEGAQKSESAPIALTTSDGAGLTLVSIEAHTVVEDPLAFTELHLVFHNPEPRRREGRFQIALPPAAAISRFAMRVGDEFQEGEVVERLRAQQVYEDFLHRKQDPALLEKASGNEFSARVFPIEANADKEIIVAYSEELAQRDEPYRLLLAGLPTLQHLTAEVLLGSSSATGLESSAERKSVTRLSVEKRDFTPNSDLELRLPKQTPFALRSGNLVVARVRPVPKSEPQELDGLTVLFDTSASRALGYAAQIERLGQLLSELARQKGKGFDVRIVAFDQDSEDIYRGDADAFGLRDKGRLLAREALGATDLAQALTFIAQKPAAHSRLLLVSDGMISAGDDDLLRLREAVARLSAHGITRFDVLTEGGVSDGDTLTELTHAGLKTAGIVLSARTDVHTLARRLRRATRERIEVQVAGASWVHPSVFEGVQAGDERLVFAELPEDAPVEITLDGAATQKLRTLETPRPLLERAYARAKIAALSTELKSSGSLDDSERAARQRAIVALSTSQRVLSDYTAMIVLESSWDYQRFGIAQNALAGILRVGEEGIALIDRTPQAGAGVRHRGEAPSEGAAVADGAQFEEEAPSEDRAPAAPSARPRRSEPARTEAKGSGGMDLAGRDRAAPAPEAPTGSAPAPAKASSQGAPPASMAAEARKDDLGLSGTGGGGGGGLGSMADVNASAGSSGARPVVAEQAENRAPALEPRAIVTVRAAAGLPSAQAASALRAISARARSCYARTDTQSAAEVRLMLVFNIDERGSVRDVAPAGEPLSDPGLQSCLLSAARALQFPKPEAGFASVQANVVLSMAAPAASSPIAGATPARPRASAAIATPSIEDAYSGELGAVLEALRAGDAGSALSLAKAARERDPADVLALVALGEVLEAQHDLPRAARVYGSLIDLFPARADLRRMAGERLERLADTGIALAVDTYRKAAAQRPDHPAGHRLLGYALLKQGRRAAAFAALEFGLDQYYPGDRFPGVERILREDLALIGAAWLRAEPDAKTQIEWALARRKLKVDRSPSVRFVLNWETDANDVDFHIYDGRGGHASYLKPRLASGGGLYADVTTGYGPECFAIPGSARAYPYVLQAHYFARGPMGYGMGKLEVIEHDGRGTLKFREAPFVIMKDKAFIELVRVAAAPE